VDGGTSPSTTFYAAAKSASGTCFYIRDVAAATNGGTMYAKGTGTCDATTGAGLTYTTNGWG
jgi:hypothetical protein